MRHSKLLDALIMIVILLLLLGSTSPDLFINK